MAITPQTGYMIDPNNPNGVVKIGDVNPNTGQAYSTVTPPTQPPPQQVPPATIPPPATTPSSSDGSQSSPPTGNLQPGSQGQDVAALQDYLVQQGYLSATDEATGKGIYGPKTTAAVAALQQKLGIDNKSGVGFFGPQTQQALAQKYKGIQQSTSGQTPPSTQSEASQIIQQQSQQSSDPVFGALAGSLAPIMQSLNQVLSNINNPALTAVSLQQEYAQLSQQNNLPQLQSQLMNMQNIMNGTTDDIRQEITTAGGTATESQVQAMSVARNNVILKQYNSLATQYQAAQTNVQNLMQYATTDQATQLQRQQATAGVVESMASIGMQAANMGLTMRQNAVSAAQYNISQTGYAPFAATLQGNPQLQGYYESLLNLAPGTLSNPQSLSYLDTYKQQQLAIAAANARNAANRTIIYASSQGIPLPGAAPSSGTTDGTGTTVSFTIPSNSLTRPSWLNPNVPITMSAADMQQYLKSNPKATVGGDAGTSASGNNITAPGIGNYIAQPDGSFILGSALPPELSNQQGVQGLITSLSNPNPPTLNYSDIAAIMQNAPGSKYSPASQPFYREQRSARQLLGNYTGSPVYATVSAAPLPFARIAAARNGNNSVSDVELLDSYITLAKGQGQITEAQISAITSASSISDKLNIIKQRVAGAGALISTDQRKSLLALSGSVFDQYAKTYQNMYTQAINVLAKNHVEPAVWGVIPDFSTMISSGDTFTGGTAPNLSSTQLYSL